MTTGTEIVKAAAKIDIAPDVLAAVPEAVELADAYRRTWIANGLPDDHNLCLAIGQLILSGVLDPAS